MIWDFFVFLFFSGSDYVFIVLFFLLRAAFFFCSSLHFLFCKRSKTKVIIMTF